MDLDALLRESVERSASDIHLKPDAPPILRINGRLEAQPDLGVVSAQFMDAAARRMLPERRYAELREGHEFDVMYGEGISRLGTLLEVGVDQKILEKSGAWFTYGTMRLGNGKDGARTFLKDNPKVAAEIEAKIRDKAGFGAGRPAEAAPGEVAGRAPAVAAAEKGR